MTIEEALEILGPIRADWIKGRHDPRKPCWLDGRKVSKEEVIQAAHDRMRKYPDA